MLETDCKFRGTKQAVAASGTWQLKLHVFWRRWNNDRHIIGMIVYKLRVPLAVCLFWNHAISSNLNQQSASTYTLLHQSVVITLKSTHTNKQTNQSTWMPLPKLS